MSENNSPNKNGANQYQLDPRQKVCWGYYIDPKSETFSNALQSALRAGYEENYAKTITVTEWFVEKVRRMNLLGKAEKVLEECLDMKPVIRKSIITKGEDGEEQSEMVAEVTDPQMVKIRQDTAKFIASTQGKDEGYSTRSELTGKNGSELNPPQEKRELSAETIKQFLDKNDNSRNNNGGGLATEEGTIPIRPTE